MFTQSTLPLKGVTLLLVGFLFSLFSITANAQYCIGYTINESEHIERVQIGNLDNMNKSWSNFSDYTHLYCPISFADSNYLKITPNTSWESSSLAVWVDWNQDYDFNDANETIFIDTKQGPWEMYFSVPNGITTGDFRMRIKFVFTLNDVQGPCTELWTGETEDYLLSVGDPMLETYCISNTSISAESIQNVQIGETSHSSNTWQTYSDFSSVVCPMTFNDSTTVVITPNYSWENSGIGAWVDWNQDYDFLDEGELVHSAVCKGPWQFKLVRPDSIPESNFRMRIRLVFTSNDSIDPCIEAWTGETEDYTIAPPDAGPLPVELLSFLGISGKTGNTLKWLTATETNNQGFILERSSDGENFDYLAFIPGSKNSTKEIAYTYRDHQPSSGINYYRLTQKDYDGQTETFDLVALKFMPTLKLSIYPNPIEDFASVRFQERFNNAEVTIISHSGQTMQQRIVTGKGFELNVADFDAGIYLMQVQHNGEQFQSKIVVK